jgi:hypothetical protein
LRILSVKLNNSEELSEQRLKNLAFLRFQEVLMGIGHRA